MRLSYAKDQIKVYNLCETTIPPSVSDWLWLAIDEEGRNKEQGRKERGED